MPIYEIIFVLNLTEGGFSNSLIHQCQNQKECGRFFIEHDAKMTEMDNWDPEKLEAEWNKPSRPPLPDWFSDGFGIVFFCQFLEHLILEEVYQKFSLLWGTLYDIYPLFPVKNDQVIYQ